MNIEQARTYRREVLDRVATTSEPGPLLADIRFSDDYQTARTLVSSARQIALGHNTARDKNRGHLIKETRAASPVEVPTSPDERFKAVFSALGNSELACILLNCLDPNSQSAYEIYKRFLRVTRNTWVINTAGPSKHCTNVLVPIGLVAQLDSYYFGSMESIKGIRCSRFGYDFGQPAANYLIVESLALPHSLEATFGATNSSGNTRSVTNRARILEALYAQSGMRELDLGTLLKLDRRIVGPHLDYLARLKYIKYRSVDFEEKGVFKYYLREGARRSEAVPFKGRQGLSEKVADIVFEEGIVDTYHVALLLQKQDQSFNTESNYVHIGSILSSFVDQGICTQELASGEVHSIAEISETGRDLVERIIRPIKQALAGDQDLLAQWRRIRWQDAAAEALERYKANSAAANKRPLSEWHNEVLLLIQRYPGIRPKDIEEQCNRSPFDLLEDLLEEQDAERRIKKVKIGKFVYYYPFNHPLPDDMAPYLVQQRAG